MVSFSALLQEGRAPLFRARLCRLRTKQPSASEAQQPKGRPASPENSVPANPHKT